MPSIHKNKFDAIDIITKWDRLINPVLLKLGNVSNLDITSRVSLNPYS
jgi:hypothetical protein